MIFSPRCHGQLMAAAGQNARGDWLWDCKVCGLHAESQEAAEERSAREMKDRLAAGTLRQSGGKLVGGA